MRKHHGGRGSRTKNIQNKMPGFRRDISPGHEGSHSGPRYNAINPDPRSVPIRLTKQVEKIPSLIQGVYENLQIYQEYPYTAINQIRIRLDELTELMTQDEAEQYRTQYETMEQTLREAKIYEAIEQTKQREQAAEERRNPCSARRPYQNLLELGESSSPITTRPSDTSYGNIRSADFDEDDL